MDHRRLELFIAVVDHGGFTAAARAVHVAQPAVSLAVKQLEREVDAGLLVRSRHGVTLTAAGSALVGPARQALRDLDVAADAVAAVTGLVAGRLDLASLPTLAADPLAEMVGRFCRAHPKVEVRLAAPTDPRDLADDVRSGSVELGVTEQSPASSGLVQRPVGEQDLVALLPPGEQHTGRPLPLPALAARRLVVTGPGTSLRMIVEQALAQAGLALAIAVETEQRDALVPLVVAGAGTAVVPGPLAASGAAQGAVVRPLEPPWRRSVVLLHRDARLSPAAARFVELALAP